MDGRANTANQGPAANDPLDRALLVVSARRHEALLRCLDDPPPPSQALRMLMGRKAPWEGPGA